MTATIKFFPVGNGDMTLITTESGKNILIDCNIRSGKEYPDVVTQLRECLTRDSQKRLFVDIFVWTHPDEDHCKGIKKHFHLGEPSGWNKNDDKIFINEVYSSPIVFRRAEKNTKKNSLTLCEDAKAFNKEVKRRVNLYKKNKKIGKSGDLVKVLGEDEKGKTDDIKNIVHKLDSEIKMTNDLSAILLGPSPIAELETDEDKLSSNESSVMMNYEIKVNGLSTQFFTLGDAEVVCNEALWKRKSDSKATKDLTYNILQVPHHCSWRAISHDSLKEAEKNKTIARVSEDALNALDEALNNAIIVASCNQIKNDDNNPPAYKAKKEYEKIADRVKGSFKCVDDHKNSKQENVPLTIVIDGPTSKVKSAASLSAGSNDRPRKVNRDGSDGYA